MSAMLTLYTNPHSRGRIARWMLEETGQHDDTVVVHCGPPMKAPEYLALNPMGKVPVHGDPVVTETPAILACCATHAERPAKRRAAALDDAAVAT